MIMEFLNPHYLSEVYELMDSRGGELKICGGMTHLLRFHSDFPRGLDSKYKGILNVGHLEALKECREEYKRYVVGANTTISQLEFDPYLLKYAPAIAMAARETSTPQIRNRRTVGGELAWGAYHSPLIVTLMALDAQVRIRFRMEGAQAGREETISLSDFYDGERERISADGDKLLTRASVTKSENLLMKVVLPEESLHRTGGFSFFIGLTPKISTENSGIVLSVSGEISHGAIQSAQVVASGLWLWPLKTRLPLESVKLQEHLIYERLHSFCERYSLEKFRRSGPSAPQLGLVFFGLLKEGFAQFLGR